MGIFSKKSDLQRIEDLQDEIIDLKKIITARQDESNNLVVQLNRKDSSYKVLVEGLRNNIAELKETMGDKIAREVAQTKKDYKQKTESLEREHSNKMKSLEKEYLEKLQRVDRKLEEDKSSYRKYLKGEFNSKVETLEKDNKNLVKENAELKGLNTGLNEAINMFKGSINPVVSLAEKIVGALPIVSAEITTPKTIDVSVNQDVGSKKN